MKISRYKLLAVCFAACVAFQSTAAFSQESNAKGAKMMSDLHPMAKEMMMRAMMMDKDISMAVKEAAMKPSESAGVTVSRTLTRIMLG